MPIWHSTHHIQYGYTHTGVGLYIKAYAGYIHTIQIIHEFHYTNHQYS